MNNYLIYVTIESQQSAKKIAELAEKAGLSINEARKIYVLDPLKEKIDKIKKKKIQLSKRVHEYGEDYILTTDTVQSVFEAVGMLTHIPIDTGLCPVEIVLAIQKIDGDIHITPETRKKVTERLTKDVITRYNGFGSTPVVLATESFFNHLDPLDKKYCKRISGESFFIVDIIKIQQRCTMFTFLKKIGHTEDTLYNRIDDVYILPVGYKDIKETLEKNRVIFITGTREYGKTYTAVHLLWEYYNKGYTPYWIKGREEHERITVRKNLTNIQSVLLPHRIIYFEDPFGRIRYEKSEELEKDIDTIIHHVTTAEDVYVIITSPEEVFKEFEKEKLSKKDIKKFEKQLHLKIPSYDYERRKEMLIKWAEAENCTWVHNDELATTVSALLTDEQQLPTPLSMRDFARATIDVDALYQLKKKIKEKSQETAKTFAKEIKNMTDDKILFLSFLFISNEFKYAFVKKMYNRFVKKLKIEKALKFEDVLAWFKDDNVIVRHGLIQFSHPSYRDALLYVLTENGHKTRINTEMFSSLLPVLAKKEVYAAADCIARTFDVMPAPIQDILIDLCNEDTTAGVVAPAVTRNMEYLPATTANKLVLTLFEKEAAVVHIAQFIAENFDKLPRAVRDALLKRIFEKEKTALSVIQFIKENFVYIPVRIRNELLLSLSERDETAEEVARIVAYNFNEFSHEVRNRLLVNLSEKEGIAWFISQVLTADFLTLPDTVRNNLLLTLSQKEEVANEVIILLVDHFDSIPDTIRNTVLVNLSQKETVADTVVAVLLTHFDTLPDSIRNTIIVTLSQNKKTFGAVAKILARNFDTFPDNVKTELLFEFSEKEEVVKDVAQIIDAHFDTLPDSIRNTVLLTLSKKEEAAQDVVRIVAQNFHDIPAIIRDIILLVISRKEKAAKGIAALLTEQFDTFLESVRNNLLVNLSEKEGVGPEAAQIVAEHFDVIPVTMRNHLLVNLSEKDGTSRYIASTVAKNYINLPKKVQNILITLAGEYESVGDVAKAVAEEYDRLPENIQNILITLTEKEETAEKAAHAIAENYDRLPGAVQKALITLTEREETAGKAAQAIIHNYDGLPRKVQNLLITVTEKDTTARHIARFIAYNFDYLCESVKNVLLVHLAEKKETAKTIAWIAEEHFDAIPDAVRNILIQRLSKKAGADAAGLLINHFDAFPHDVRTPVLLTLSQNRDAAVRVAQIVGVYFDDLSEGVRTDILMTLCEYDTAAEDVARVVAHHFDDLSSTVRITLVKTLSHKRKASPYVVWIVAYYFDTFPDAVRNTVVKTLSEKENVAGAVAGLIVSYFDAFPKDIQDIVAVLAGQDSAGDVAKAIAYNYGNLPDTVRDLLDELQEPLQLIITSLAKSPKMKDKREAVHLISNALPKINKRFALEILKGLASCKDEAVRKSAAEIVKNILDTLKG
jgi:hypothetical protein